jgi:uncharacterized protein
LRPHSLPVRICDGQLIPGFLGDADLPWVRALLELALAHRGAPWRDLEARLRRPVLDHVPPRRQNVAVSVLRRLLRGRVDAVIPPRQIRRLVFRLASCGDHRDAVLAKAAQELGVEASLLEAGLFADLPPERLVIVPEQLPAPGEIALQANLYLVRTLLSRAVEVEIRLRGNARAVLRVARLRGLLCTVARSEDLAADAVLQLSGPLSLFRRTTIYGRALGSLIPCLAWSDAFDLRANCLIADREVRLRLKSGDPFLPAEEPRRYDSKLETRLARALMRMAPDWIVVREPEPIPVEDSFIFPDFALDHRYDAGRRWLLEIVGFWTPDYLATKLRRYRQARIERLILCIDERRACSDGDLPTAARIVRFRDRVPPEAVLAILSQDCRVGGGDDVASAAAAKVAVASSPER